MSFFSGVFFANAYGGTNPAVVGHSPQEINVTDDSIHGSISGSKIDVTTLSGTAAGLTAGAASSASSASSASQAGFVTSAPGCGSNNFLEPDMGSCYMQISTNGNGFRYTNYAVKC